MKRAAQIRRKDKKLTVQQSVKKAAAENRAKKKTAPRKKTARKKVARKSVVRKSAPRKSASRKKVASIPAAVSGVKAAIVEKIAVLEVRKFKATGVRDKRKIAKEISKHKSMYRKLDK